MSPRSLSLAFVLSLLVSMTGCTTTVTQSKATYDVDLTVERPAAAANKFGKETVSKAPKALTFEDGLLKAKWTFDEWYQFLDLRLENKSEQSIRIAWDDAAFVGIDGNSNRLIHGEVQCQDRTRSQPPVTVVKKQVLSARVFSAANVSTSEYGPGCYVSPYLPSQQYTSTAPLEPGKTAELAQQKKQGAEFAAAVRHNVGKSWKVLLPLQLDDARHEYLFTFMVRDVKAETETYDTETFSGKRKP